MKKSNSILVIGANGFIGHRLIMALASSGAHVIALSRRPTITANENIEWIVGDLAEVTVYRDILPRCSQAIHVASDSTPGSSAGRPFHEGVNNILPTLALIEALQQHPTCRLIFVSTGGAIYGDAAFEHTTENMPLSPHSYYGAGKIAIEHFITAYSHQFDANTIILRPSNIYGPHQQFRSGFGIIPTAMNCLASGKKFHIWGDGSTVRDYLYIDDFISLCLLVIEDKKIRKREVYNAGSGRGVTINNLLSLLENISQKKLQRTYDSSRKVDINHIVLNSQSVYDAFHWHPTTGLEEGVKRTWLWFIENKL